MARPRKQTYTLKMYLDKIKDQDIDNEADTQRDPEWKPIINGLMTTILTDDYIPPIILAEEDNSQLHIVDGGGRTAALNILRHGNYRISSKLEDSIIPYKKKVKCQNGEIIWEDAELDIRGKTYEELPKELRKKFDEYQIETVIHENCDKNKIAMYIKRYNEHTSMNTHQKAFTYISNFAGNIRKILKRDFFINYSCYTEKEKHKGVTERVVMESLMCMFYLDYWKSRPQKNASFLNKNSSCEDFAKLNDNLGRLENIITYDIKDVFNSKNSFIWITLFNEFTSLNVDDIKFAEFIKSFKDFLKDKPIDGQTFDDVDSTGGTKDKKNIIKKLHILRSLMMEYLHINEEDIEEIDTLEFIKENVKEDITQEDIDFYDVVLEDLTLNVDNNTKLLDKKNKPSLLALTAYACENDIDLDSWIRDFFSANSTYKLNQKENYIHMKENLDNYLEAGGL